METTLKFDIYGRFEIEVVRQNGEWVVFQNGAGLKVPRRDVAIPREVGEDSLKQFLDDHFHEWAKPGDAVRRIG